MQQHPSVHDIASFRAVQHSTRPRR